MRSSTAIASSFSLLLAAGMLAGCVAATDGTAPSDEGVGASSDAIGGTWMSLDTAAKGAAAEIRFDAQTSTSEVSYFDVVIHGFYVETKQGPNGVYSKITVPGLATMGRLGAPMLPVFRADVAVPAGASATRMTVAARKGTRKFEAMNVWPQPTPELDAPGLPERFAQDRAIYALTTNWPASDALGGKATSKMDGITGATAEGYPFKWTPSTKTLTVDPYTRYAVYHPGTAGTPRVITQDRAQVAAQKFANWGLAQAGYIPNLTKYEGEFLFIYPAKYATAIAPLVTQKKTRGYTTTQLTTATTGNTCASIRTAINAWYAGRPASADKYLLLVGDVDEIPTCTSPTNVPTDDLYASTNGDDLDEEVYVGRLSVDDATDLTNQVTKILRYEDSPELFFNYGQTLLVAHKEGAPGKYVGAHESVRTATYAVPPVFTTIYGSDAAATNATVSAAINTGRGLVAYRGHGSETEWWSWDQTNQSFVNADVVALTNAPVRSPVLWSFACSNSALGTSDSFAETWMKTNRDAVSFYGATVPSGTDANHELDRRMFKAVFDLGITTQAKAIQYAEAQMATLVGPANAWMYLLLGDPEMRIRRGRPLNIITKVPTAINRCIGPACGLQLQILTEQGMPLPNVRVSAHKVGVRGDEVLDNRFTGKDGRVTLPIQPGTPGALQIVVTDAEGNTAKTTVSVL